MSQANLTSPNIGLLVFAVVTIVYFIVEYKSEEKHSAIATISYMILLFLFQFLPLGGSYAILYLFQLIRYFPMLI